MREASAASIRQGKHLCAVDGCAKIVASYKIMCGEHWQYVPKELRIRIYRYNKDGSAVAWTKAIEEARAYVEIGVTKRLRRASGE